MTSNQFREILIFAAGSSPQVITETIQALSLADPPVYADEIYIIATAPDRSRIEQKLIKEGVLSQLCEEWEIPRVPLIEDSFVVFTDHRGEPLDDIRTVEENECAGDQIAHFLRSKASIPGTRMHCSIAGGRKTMAFYMGTAFQLFARQWDRLYHVIVSYGFERNETFFYKPKQNRPITISLPDGTSHLAYTDEAEIFLTELPLIYLRDKLPLTGHGVRELVKEGQREIDHATVLHPITINLDERTLCLGKTKIEISPLQLTVYTAFLRLKKNSCEIHSRENCHGCAACFITLVEMTSPEAIAVMASDYSELYGDDPFRKEDLQEKWGRNLDVEYLRQQISKINSAIKKKIQNEFLLHSYLISTIRKYGHSRYGVRIDKSRIKIIAVN